jgi:hypothetical protein
MKPSAPPAPHHARRPAGATALAAGAAVAMLMSACAVTTARMQQPAELQGAEPLAMGPVPGGTRGSVVAGGEAFAFERSGESISWFGTARSSRGTLTLRRGSGDEPFLRCNARRLELERGSAAVTVKPLALGCEGPGRSLQLQERLRLQAAEREGEYRTGTTVLQLRSVHRLQGSPLPLEQPAGYVLSHEGRPVAALDVAGGQPRLVLQVGGGDERRRAVLEAALVLALAWEQ